MSWGLSMAAMGAAGFVGVLYLFTHDMPDLDELAIPKRAPSITIMAANGQIMGRRGTVHAGRIGVGELPKHLVQAVIATEDRRFYEHIGVDFIGLARAFYANYKAGKVVQGGSTLTQQLAKNLFLKPERRIKRKVQEAVLALRLEGTYTKNEIIELYLNRVYFGAGTYGIEAAAERYFHKSAREVTLGEAAMLAGLLKAPSRYSPASHQDRAIKRATVVLSNMSAAGFITDEEKFVAAQVLKTPQARSDEHETAPYILDWVAESLTDVLGEPRGDLVIETTIDLKLQAIAIEEARKVIEAEGEAKKATQAAVVVMDSNGATQALVGGLDYKTSQFNRAVKGLRQPGSTFKMLVYLAAMEAGYTPFDERVDRAIKIADWEPKNYSQKYRGLMTLTEALGRSVNTVAAQVGNEIGLQNVIDLARRLGITSPMQPNPSLSLGTNEVSLFELTGAIVPLSNGGTGVTPHVIRRVFSAEGQVLYERHSSLTIPVLQSDHVASMNYMLSGVVAWGTGKRAQLQGHQVAGKTGTTQDYRDAWFIGYTGHFTGGVWVGNDDNSTMNRVTGGSLPASIWKNVMTVAHEGKDPVSLPIDVIAPAFREPEPDRFVSRGPIGGLFGQIFGFGRQQRREVVRQPVAQRRNVVRSPFEGPPLATGRRLPVGVAPPDNFDGYALPQNGQQVEQNRQVQEQPRQRSRGLFGWGTTQSRNTERRKKKTKSRYFNTTREKNAYLARQRELRRQRQLNN